VKAEGSRIAAVSCGCGGGLRRRRARGSKLWLRRRAAEAEGARQ